MGGNWPRFSDYNAAFHSPETGLIPFELKRASVARNGFGSPDPLSGGFTYIYRLTLPDGTRKAVRVFMQQDPVRDVRMPWVVKRLEEAKLQYQALQKLFLPCHWFDPCVHTPMGDVPGLVMDWSDGQTLGEWLRKHKGNAASIREFREQFFQMMKLLEDVGVAHGDLQVGNILVNREGRPVLVDYDGVAFFDEGCPSPLQGGHPNFQHPARPSKLPNSQLDRFSAITIDLGLLAWGLFAEAPWFLSMVSDSDRLYFSRSDFSDPEYSEAFARLREYPQLATAARELEALCKGDPVKVPTLAEFCSQVFPMEVQSVPVAVESVPAQDTCGKALKPEQKSIREVWQEKEIEYLPVFPLFSALDVGGLGQRVGEMVEVIGKITEIHEGETKYGDPYVFVNFMDWKEPLIFHLVAWSEDLDELEDSPDEEWVGKWIQVTGLLEEPYVRKSLNRGRGEQVRFSIRLRKDQQFRFLTPQKARARLKAASKTSFPHTESFESSSPRYSPPSFPEYLSSPSSTLPSLIMPYSSPSEPPASSNQELLKRLQTFSSPTSPSPTGLGSSFGGQSHSSPPGKWGAPYDSKVEVPWFILIVIVGITLFLLTLAYW